MAKIAALILPSAQAGKLESLCNTMRDALCLYSAHQLQMNTYRGERAVCALLRVKPDPLNPEDQPVWAAESACVACGYYFSAAAEPITDSAGRLSVDLASEGGVAALARGDGVYAFVFWDQGREHLVAGVDKLGMRPLYWAALPGGGYAVASELKVLVALAGQIDVNWAAWEEHLAFGYVFGNHTFFSGMYRFGAAQAITFRHDGQSSRIVERFLENIEIEERPVETFLEEQGAVFDAAMTRLKSLYNAPERTMLTLSGGYDSRRILGWLLNHDIRPEAYTIPEVLSDGSEFESAIVRELCQVAGISGHSVYPTDAADRAHLRVLRDLMVDFESDEHVFSVILAMGLDCHDKVNFDGLAAGSQLSGSFMSPAYFEPGGDEKFVANWRRPPQWLSLPHLDMPPLHERVRAELDRWGDHPNRFSYFYLLGRTRREVSLGPLGVQANVFESLCPYLDRDMMRSAFSFPPERKVDAHLQMPMIAALHPALGRVQTAYMQNGTQKTGGVRHSVKSQPMKGVEQYGERRTLLRNMARLPTMNAGWSMSTTQKWRFQLASLLAPFLPDEQLFWEFEKAIKLAQLVHFEQTSQTPADYSQAVSALNAAFGSRANWRKVL